MFSAEILLFSLYDVYKVIHLFIYHENLESYESLTIRKTSSTPSASIFRSPTCALCSLCLYEHGKYHIGYILVFSEGLGIITVIDSFITLVRCGQNFVLMKPKTKIISHTRNNSFNNHLQSQSIM